jgi:hypothetical protein
MTSAQDWSENEPQETENEQETTPELVAPVHHLPASSADLPRKSLAPKSLIDQVDELFGKIWDESAEFRSLQEALFDSDAVEGSLKADDYKGALFMRDWVAEGHPVKEQKMESLARALRYARKRWGISRTTRLQQLGEIEA